MSIVDITPTKATKGQSAKSTSIPTVITSIVDTTFAFTSSQDFDIQSDPTISSSSLSFIGADIHLSSGGYGVGIFGQLNIADNIYGFVTTSIAGIKNSNEVEVTYDPLTGRWLVPGKVNRLYSIPLFLGASTSILSETFSDSFQPFISVAAGPTLVVRTPYQLDAVSALKQASVYTRFGGYAACGAQVYSGKTKVLVQMRYTYVPFGGEGLESVRGVTINNFGGLSFVVSVGL